MASQIDSSCALRVRHMAEQYHLPALQGQATEYMDMNLAAVSEHDDWLALSAEEVGEVLGRDELRPGKEINVFRALVRWARRGAASVSASRAMGGGGVGGGGGGGGGCSSFSSSFSPSRSSSSSSGSGSGRGSGWAAGDREARFAELLGRCVRLPQMSRDELQLAVMMDPIVQNDPQAVQLVMRAMNEKIVRLRGSKGGGGMARRD